MIKITEISNEQIAEIANAVQSEPSELLQFQELLNNSPEFFNLVVITWLESCKEGPLEAVRKSLIIAVTMGYRIAAIEQLEELGNL